MSLSNFSPAGPLIVQKYQPYASDPNLSGALASVLWELDLLSKHYHSDVSTIASGVATMSTAHNQVYLSTLTPQQAFKNMSLEVESFSAEIDIQKSNFKRKRGNGSLMSARIEPTKIDENELSKKLSRHFMVVRDVKENERLRGELDRTKLCLQLYEEYKKQKMSEKPKSVKRKKLSVK